MKFHIRLFTSINSFIGSLLSFPIKINGIKFYFKRLDRMVALICWKLGILEAKELKVFLRLLCHDSHFVDIGGNMGLYSFLATTKIINGKIHTFEPDPQHFECLNKTLIKNNIKNVSLHQMAVSNQDGEMSFQNNSLNGGNFKLSWDILSTKVKTITLDSFLANDSKVDIIKMDIQGSEYFALLGMTSIIKNNPNIIIFFEYSPSCMSQLNVSPEMLISLIKDLRLNIYEIDKSLTKISYEKLAQLRPMGIKNILLSPKELHYF